MAAVRNEDLRDMILDRTLHLLQTDSFSDISLAAIAQASNISKGTLYYYYHSKDDILFDIIDLYLTQLAQQLIAWTADPKKDTNIRRLLTFVLQRGSSNEFGNIRLYLISEAISQDHQARRRYIEKYQYFQTLLRSLIKERLPQSDADYLSWVLLTLMDGILIQGQLENPSFDREAFIERSVKLMCSHI